MLCHVKNNDKLKEKIQGIYKEVDDSISMLSIPCKKGCFYCCLQNAWILSVEKYVIRECMEEAIKENELILDNILSWFDYFNNNTPDGKY